MKLFIRLFFTLLLLLNINYLFAQAPVVTGVSPQRQIINASRNSTISVTFNTALNVQTVNSSTFRVFARLSGPVPGTFQFQSGNTQVIFTPTTPFLAGEWVTVALSKGIQSSNNTPMVLGFNWNFWTKAEPGTLNVNLIQTIPVRRTGEGLIQCYGALGTDFNDDGKPDLAIVNEISVDYRIFLNNGTGYDTIFAIHPVPSGSYPSPSEAGDFNNDGRVDIAIGNAGNSVMNTFMGAGGANFLPGVVHTSGNLVRGVAMGDLNGDGFDDIVTANRGGSNISIFRNNGNGTFAAAQNINTVGNSETAVMLTDANNDGILDAFVGCYSSSEIVLLLGDGNGSFTFSSRAALGGQPWAIQVGDMNGDGNADVAAALSNVGRIGVIFGNGSGGLGTATTYTSANFTLAIDIGDVDGDNDLDLISSNYGGGNYKVYGNNGAGVYTNTPITLPATSAGSCITVLDRDNDGDMDLAGIDEVDDFLFIFNNGPVNIDPISSEIPSAYILDQNYPNPFNPVTKIRFDISSESFTRLTIYDALGKEIQTLLNQKLKSGKYEIVWNGAGFQSGIYFYKIQSGDFISTKKMVMVK